MWKGVGSQPPHVTVSQWRAHRIQENMRKIGLYFEFGLYVPISVLLQVFPDSIQVPSFSLGGPGNQFSGYPCGHQCVASHPLWLLPSTPPSFPMASQTLNPPLLMTRTLSPWLNFSQPSLNPLFKQASSLVPSLACWVHPALAKHPAKPVYWELPHPWYPISLFFLLPTLDT